MRPPRSERRLPQRSLRSDSRRHHRILHPIPRRPSICPRRIHHHQRHHPPHRHGPTRPATRPTILPHTHHADVGRTIQHLITCISWKSYHFSPHTEATSQSNKPQPYKEQDTTSASSTSSSYPSPSTVQAHGYEGKDQNPTTLIHSQSTYRNAISEAYPKPYTTTKPHTAV